MKELKDQGRLNAVRGTARQGWSSSQAFVPVGLRRRDRSWGTDGGAKGKSVAGVRRLRQSAPVSTTVDFFLRNNFNMICCDFFFDCVGKFIQMSTKIVLFKVHGKKLRPG